MSPSSLSSCVLLYKIITCIIYIQRTTFINVYNLMNLDICKLPWWHHYNQENRHIQYLPKFSCVPLFFIFALFASIFCVFYFVLDVTHSSSSWPYICALQNISCPVDLHYYSAAPGHRCPAGAWYLDNKDLWGALTRLPYNTGKPPPMMSELLHGLQEGGDSFSLILICCFAAVP